MSLPPCFHSSQFCNAPWRLEEAEYEYRSQASCEDHKEKKMCQDLHHKWFLFVSSEWNVEKCKENSGTLGWNTE